jgi:PAS domain-containing protein
LPLQTFIDLFSLKDLIPHGYCLAWSPLLLWLSIISDALITVAYYLMPLIMIYFIRQRRDLLYSRLALLIALFIVACGTTHLIHIITIWIPIYSLEILIKFLTAILSVITTVSMFYIVPKALSLPSTTQLQNEVTQRLIVEKVLWESNNKLNTILDNIPAHVFVKDANCNYLYINKAVEDYFGIDKEHIIGFDNYHSNSTLFFNSFFNINYNFCFKLRNVNNNENSTNR